MKIVTKSALAALIAATCLPGLASAQDSRLSISVTPAVATSSGDSQLAVAGSVGYRFSSHFTFEGEVTWIDAATGGVRDRNFNFDPRVSAATTECERDVRRQHRPESRQHVDAQPPRPWHEHGHWPHRWRHSPVGIDQRRHVDRDDGRPV
jgi:hypothetical protein